MRRPRSTTESCVLPPAVDLGPDVLSCSGTAVLIAPEGDASNTWSTGETLASIVVTEPGSYSVTAVLNSPEPAVDGFQFLYTSQGLDHFLSNSTASWSQAHLICQQNGGDLVSISDNAANSMLGIIDVQDAWIGLYQDDDNALWQWTDGSNFDFQNWRSDQPSGSGQHCVLFWPEAAPSGAPEAQNIWSDETCTDVHHFLMAKPTASYSCEASDTVHVQFTYLPDPIELGADIYTCDSTVQLEAGGGFDAYLWSNGETTSSIEVTEIGDYAVEATLGSTNQRAVQLHAPTILESSTDPLINGIFAGLHPFSVSLWVKADQLGGVELCDKGYSNSASGPNASSMQLFSGADGLSFQLFTDANHWMGLSTSPATGLLEGEWNHVVCTYNGGTTSDALRLYVNGADLDLISTPIQQGTFSGLHANAEPLHFGGRTSASGVNAHPSKRTPR